MRSTDEGTLELSSSVKPTQLRKFFFCAIMHLAAASNPVEENPV
jgi:hypothetical protein